MLNFMARYVDQSRKLRIWCRINFVVPRPFFIPLVGSAGLTETLEVAVYITGAHDWFFFRAQAATPLGRSDFSTYTLTSNFSTYVFFSIIVDSISF